MLKKIAFFVIDYDNCFHLHPKDNESDTDYQQRLKEHRQKFKAHVMARISALGAHEVILVSGSNRQDLLNDVYNSLHVPIDKKNYREPSPASLPSFDGFCDELASEAQKNNGPKISYYPFVSGDLHSPGHQKAGFTLNLVRKATEENLYTRFLDHEDWEDEAKNHIRQDHDSSKDFHGCFDETKFTWLYHLVHHLIQKTTAENPNEELSFDIEFYDDDHEHILKNWHSYLRDSSVQERGTSILLPKSSCLRLHHVDEGEIKVDAVGVTGKGQLDDFWLTEFPKLVCKNKLAYVDVKNAKQYFEAAVLRQFLMSSHEMAKIANGIHAQLKNFLDVSQNKTNIREASKLANLSLSARAYQKAINQKLLAYIESPVRHGNDFLSLCAEAVLKVVLENTQEAEVLHEMLKNISEQITKLMAEHSDSKASIFKELLMGLQKRILQDTPENHAQLLSDCLQLIEVQCLNNVTNKAKLTVEQDNSWSSWAASWFWPVTSMGTVRYCVNQLNEAMRLQDSSRLMYIPR